jgi:aspartokinase/homoserine dehydrogenase 1
MNLRVAGLTNSTKMVFNDQGIQEEDLKTLQNGEPSTPHKFAEEIINRNLRNSIFVDVTANAKVVDIYEDLLKKV